MDGQRRTDIGMVSVRESERAARRGRNADGITKAGGRATYPEISPGKCHGTEADALKDAYSIAYAELEVYRI